MDISGHGRIRVLVTGIYVTGILHLVNQTPAALFCKRENSVLSVTAQNCATTGKPFDRDTGRCEKP
jgi:hypothetical protein